MPIDNMFIELRGVEKYYDSGENKTHILKNINLQISRGEMVVIKGASGSGKTTLLNLIGGLDRPNEGQIMVAGVALEQQGRRELTRFRAEEVGFIFQFHNLIPTLTVEENVLTGIEAKRPINKIDRVNVSEYLRRVDLLAHRAKFPAKLSGGQQQRVAIARALVKSPQIILADEPTGSLDEETGRMIIELIRSIRQEINATVLLVTHNQEIAESADRIVELKSGRIARKEDEES